MIAINLWGHLAGLASRLLSKTLAKRFQAADIDMTAEQWGAILVLLNGDAMTQAQLGEQLYLEKSLREPPPGRA